MSSPKTPAEHAAMRAVLPEAGDAHLRDLAEELAGVGRFRFEFASGRVTWSDEVFRICGLPNRGGEVDLALALSCYRPDDAEKLSALIARSRQTGEGYEIELPIRRHSDGDERRVTARAVVERDAEGRLAALAGVFMDVTDTHRANRRLAESEAQFRLIADHASDLIVRFAPQGAIRYCSPSIRRWGYEPEELHGRYMIEFIHPDDVAHQFAIVAALFAPGPPDPDLDRTLRARRKDGSYVWMEGAPSIVRDAAGKPVEIISVFRDVSARKAIEAELILAKEAAEAAAEAKAEFLANMSHELRTPLTSVLGFSRLAAAQPELTDETRRHLLRVSHAGQALLCAVNDILDLSKLEAGQLEIQPRRMDPAQLARDTLDLFSTDAAARELRLVAEGLESLPPVVEADPDRLRQVLLNLLANAVKFTDRGSVTLRAAYDRPTGALAFAVIDTGCGIPPAGIPRLFQRFSQVDGSVARRHGGTGLGLAITKRLVEAMGGAVHVESEPGLGSTFGFGFPAPTAASEPVADHTDAATRGGLAGARVLVVDDNAANRELVRALLTPAGVEMTLADSGAAALDAASAERFDAVLLDLRMPGLDGHETAARLRAGGGPNAETPVLAFSADALATLSADFDGLIAKPLSPSGLATALATVLAPMGQGGLRPRRALG